MLKAWNQCSRQRGVGYPALPVSLFLWSFLLLCFAAAEQAALAQQKTATAAPAAAEAFNASGIGTGSRAIDGLWQFHLGDDLRWAQPGFDDSGWERLPADKPWASYGHKGATGFAWYRRKISLDSADKNELSLYLTELAHTAEVYWNGVKVGGVGKMPPKPFYSMISFPSAIPLPSTPGANSGMLAIRVWTRTNDKQAPDIGGFNEAPQLGYTPIIRQMQEDWGLKLLRAEAVPLCASILFLSVGLVALLLWLRSPARGILFCAGIYFTSNALQFFSVFTPSLSYRILQFGLVSTSFLKNASFVFLMLLLGGLPNRPGFRGFRFWKRVCVAAVAVLAFLSIVAAWEVLPETAPNPTVYNFLEKWLTPLHYSELPQVVAGQAGGC